MLKITHLHQRCQHIVKALLEKNEWELMSEADLVKALFEAAEPGASDRALTELVKQIYAAAHYESCSQVDQPARRERGYRELHHLLLRIAYNRWPDLAQDVTHKALVLIFDQLNRCQSPETFHSFAFFKLLQTYKDEIYQPKIEIVSLKTVETEHEPAFIVDLESLLTLERRELAGVLLQAISRLNDERQKQVIMLKFFAGRTDKEIAQDLDVTSGNVRVLRRRGMIQLQQDNVLRKYWGRNNDE